ncbi:MAG: hypothetical protein IH612_21245, partial [Desulfofustis sp.]|nr:hypothetical protein [Desulfofustis sp.]
MEKRYVCSMKGAGNHLVCRATMSMVALSGLLLWAGSDATADWRIEAGPIFRSSMETEAGGTSHTQLLGLQTAQPYSIRPALSRGRAAIVEANPDDITEIRERIFDDGFVGIDLLTFADGLTVYFGYDSDSQYNEAERSLTFIRTELQPRTVTVDRGTERSRTVQTDLDTDLGVDDRFNGWGVRFDALRSLAFTHGADISLSLGLRGYKDLG